MDKHYLDGLLNPKSVALICDETTPQDVRELLTERIRAPKSLQTGVITWDSERWHGDPPVIEMAVISCGSDRVLSAIEEVAHRKGKAAIVLSTGLSEAQTEALRTVAMRHNISLLGPSSLGIQRPSLGLNASLMSAGAPPGRIALVSQSGALASAILDWAADTSVGFSAVVTLGMEVEVDLAQVLDYLAYDVQTQSIIIYLECIRDARSFMSAMRAAASVKPVIVMKSGRHGVGSGAALTHSSALVGANAVVDAALRRAGAVRVQFFVQLFSAVRVLTSRRRTSGKRLGLISNGRGPALIAQDLCGDNALAIAELSDATKAALSEAGLPSTNPINLGSYADEKNYEQAIKAIGADSNVDGVLVMYSPHATEDAEAIANAVISAAKPMEKSVLGCWMGDHRVHDLRAKLSSGGVPTFRTPETALDAMLNVASFYANQQLLQQVPPPMSSIGEPDIDGARMIVESALAERRRVLTEMESKSLLSAFGIPVATTMVVRSVNEAALVAQQIGFPIAMKINSYDITHKSEVGGVTLNLNNALEVRNAYNEMLSRVKAAHPEAKIDGVAVQSMIRKTHGREVFIGVVTDPLFGPVITFGAGGTNVELIRDRAMELPPLNSFLAHKLIERTRVARLLDESPMTPAAHLESLEQLLLRVSEMVCELPSIREMDINPILVDESGAIAVDARIVVEPEPPMSRGRYSHLAILPYPSYLHWEYPRADGTSYRIRPIRWEDSGRLQDLVRNLSDESRYFRFISNIKELPPRLLARYTQVDYHRDMALVAVTGEGDEERIVGVSRYMQKPDGESCEFALVVADDWAGHGLGSRLMNALIDVAASKGLRIMDGYVLAQNPNMLRLMRKLGFTVKPDPEDAALRLVSRPL